jgi:hypothetical protein
MLHMEALMISTPLRRVVLLALSTVTLACWRSVATDTDTPPEPVNHDRSLLTTEELRAAHDQYLYDIVQRLRPEWLRTHGASSLGTGVAGNPDADQVQVYVGQVRLGGPDVLERLATSAATSLKYYTAAQAQQRFGPGHPNGAIQVLSVPPAPSPP